MDKRVYGVLGVSSIMANWNADFSGYPKTTSNGDIFGSDKAFKHPMKKMWKDQGDKVLYIKSLRFEKDKKGIISLIPKSLKERYEEIFGVADLKKNTNAKEILTNLFKAVDVKNFGATFAEAGANISITGAVQLGQGFNKYEECSPHEQNILSPFRDATKATEEKGEAKNSTLGTKVVTDEAHYFYPFVINPASYDDYVALGVTEGYTEEDYKKFKETALVSATAFATNAKEGCENEFALFVETDSDLYLPNLTSYLTFEKEEEKDVITISAANILDEVKDQIKSIEVYYNPHTTEVVSDIENTKYYHIITRKEV